MQIHRSLENESVAFSSSILKSSENVIPMFYRLQNAAQMRSQGMIEYDLSKNAIITFEKERENLKALIKEFALLGSNWDGYNALAVPQQVIDNALSFFELLKTYPIMFNPEISPKANGTISFAWEMKSAEACIEIGLTQFSGYVKQHDGALSLFEGLFKSITYELIEYIFSSLTSFVSPSMPITKIYIEE